MNCGFICEVLQYLLKDRFGTQLVKLSVDLADVDNKAALDLLCALFKHSECHKNSSAFAEYTYMHGQLIMVTLYTVHTRVVQTIIHSYVHENDKLSAASECHF